ncbi:MAG: hypothetical protein EOO06_20955 [Chitinophagaceae bacterium]|nr:MAG: hypothetical protein EOO06_20955 [Chitinophagaceae bacterium]
MREYPSFRVIHACRILGYSRQAYYQSLYEKAGNGEVLAHLLTEACMVRQKSPSKGCRSMYERFGSSLPIGRDKSIGLLMDLGFRVKHPKRYGRATQSGTREFPNLLVDKIVTGINQVWQADMAHYLYGDRKYYTMYITDVYSQEIVGYGAYSTNVAANYARVLEQALKRAREYGPPLAGLIHHSDGGKQYESMGYKQLCRKKGIHQSMCMYSYENPYAEKTNDLINNAYLNVWRPKSLSELSKAQRKAVMDHNMNSNKKVLGKLSPLQFKRTLTNSKMNTGNYSLILKPRNPEQPRKKMNSIN